MIERTRAGAKEIILGKLYQRGQFLTWSRSQKDTFLAYYKINTIVNLWTKLDNELLPKSNDWLYIHWPIESHTLPAKDTMAYLLNMLVDFMHQEDRVLLVHCEAGVSRSIFLSVLLVARYYGWSGMHALGHVEKCCGRSKLAKEQMEYLLKIE